MRVTLLLVISLLFMTSVPAQKVLAIENVYRMKRIIFQPGEFIRFQTHDGNSRYNGVIESVNDSMMVIVRSVKMENEGDATNNLFRDYVPLREISVVYDPTQNYWKYFKNMYSGLAMIGGGMLLTFTAINSWTQDRAPDPGSVVIATSIMTSGFIVKYIGRDKFRIGKKWQIRSMEPMILDSEKPSK